MEVVCGAWNFEVGDLVPLAPVGAVLPGGFAIGKRKMKGVVSHGMLCSGRELRISEDHEGILRLNDVAGAAPGVLLVDALGLQPDLVFDVAVEANRPDAWSIVGVARDLAARLRLPFSVPDPPAGPADRAEGGGGATGAGGSSGASVTDLASVRVDDLELCPRFTARVLTGVRVGPSPEWLARRLVLAGMRPINNVVDASNYVMLELGQPTHPYDLDRLGGHGLLVRRAHPGESVTTLDGVERTLGRPGPGLGDTGQDCLICDAEGAPVGIGGVMGGASSEIDGTTTRVLLEAAYFVPMAIARTSKRLALRTEASARFERGCDPAGIDRAADRFCELLALTAGPDLRVASGVIDVVGDVPEPVQLTVRPAKINALLGTSFTAPEVAGLLAPLGITVSEVAVDGDDALDVTVPTFRPDIRPAPMGEADIAEEVARTYGYVRIARTHALMAPTRSAHRPPAGPSPGEGRPVRSGRQRGMDDDVPVRERPTGLGLGRALRGGHQPTGGGGAVPADVDGGRPGAVSAVQPRASPDRGPALRDGLGLPAFRCRADADGADRAAETSERLSVVFAADGDDAWTAVSAWRTIAEALGVASWSMGGLADAGAVAVAVHPYRSSTLIGEGAAGGSDGGGSDGAPDPVVLGVVGELDPSVVGRFDLLETDGRPRRVGWLDLDLGTLLDRGRVARRPDESRPVSRFPSSDIDLAFVVGDRVPAGSVEQTLRRAGGDLMEGVELFDVYRGTSLPEASRSLAYHLRFCALDRTLTDEEIGSLRAQCIAAVEGEHQASLR